MPARGGIQVSWAQHEDEVRAAQKLRFDVFAGEMGAQLEQGQRARARLERERAQAREAAEELRLQVESAARAKVSRHFWA